MNVYFKYLFLLFLCLFFLISCSLDPNHPLTQVAINEQNQLTLSLPLPTKIKKNIARNIFHNTNFSGLRNPNINYQITLYELNKKKKKITTLLFQKGYQYDHWAKIYFINQKINEQSFFDHDKSFLIQHQNKLFKNKKLKIIGLEKEFSNSLQALFEIDTISIFPIELLENQNSKYFITAKLTFFQKDLTTVNNIWQKIILFLISIKSSYKTKPFEIIKGEIKI